MLEIGFAVLVPILVPMAWLLGVHLALCMLIQVADKVGYKLHPTKYLFYFLLCLFSWFAVLGIALATRSYYGFWPKWTFRLKERVSVESEKIIS